MTELCRYILGAVQTRRESLAFGALALVVALLPPLLLAQHWLALRTLEPMGIEAFVDTGDIRVYFESSSWIVGGPPLYSGTPSEYPLLANLVFAAVRVVSGVWRPVSDTAGSFEATWVVIGWWTWLGMLLALWRWAPQRAIWLWLTPAALYFTLYRYDTLPVVATFAALLMARGGRLRTAALILGIAIALKGYALFAVPAFAVWVAYQREWREAAVATFLAIAPLAACVVLIFALSGPTAALYPFRFHALRGPNGESTWDVVEILLGTEMVRELLQGRLLVVPFALSALTAFAAAALRPRTFDELLGAFIVAVGGYATFSVFYSPQFYLWFVPAAALSNSLMTLIPLLALGWVTIVYFPISFFALFPRTHTRFFRIVVVVVTVLRTAVVVGALLEFVLTRRSPRRSSR